MHVNSLNLEEREFIGVISFLQTSCLPFSGVGHVFVPEEFTFIMHSLQQ